ncbi:Putative methyltransferase type 12, S-adenosyl-L-methionine-dependent methyltransferase [Septoria linicola]|uniref:Methyltransferase type 12, S-adenosyl-L-methionine-dependent methyltransferase n=1 Tax=Septoria linicola TaxID=215465 RepID=A0A9Q9EQV7_9PEZI|nr:Putative methyltransferase type 12, S-adenosyl-L-methionine-dependent methyltransferase [Septoria linicola]
MAATQEQDASLTVRTKQPKAQLTKGMEHMRQYVTVKHSSPTNPSTTGEDAYGVPASFEPIRNPATDSKDNPHKRSDPFQFGSRYLEDGDDMFAHNAWDHVSVDPEYNEFIEQQTLFQRANQVSDFDKKRFNERPEKWWDRFYSNNQANFFKDRKWLVQEFPILGEVTQANYGPVTVLEVGAGAGNTAFPVLANNQNPELRLHACDYSKKAIEVIRAQPAYNNQERSILQADVWDAAGTELPPDLAAGSVDVIVMIFIFSALSPDQWTQAVSNAYTLLKPGGEILFRDYGRGDLAQVRFKKGRYLEENFYVRGDGTRVYFFDEQELRDIWGGRRIAPSASQDNQEEAQGSDGVTVAGESGPCFEIVNLAVDRRMLVNRQRKLKMYRCWMQGRFRKPIDDTSGTPIGVVGRTSASSAGMASPESAPEP